MLERCVLSHPGTAAPIGGLATARRTKARLRARSGPKEQAVEIGAGWVKKGKTSGEDYVSLSLADPAFGPKKLYANLGRAAGQDDENVFAVIWNPVD